MDEKLELTVNVCGPSQGKCDCKCPESCGHKWDGPLVKLSNGGSASCSTWGMLAIERDLWVMP
jgi:hypothetical protein